MIIDGRKDDKPVARKLLLIIVDCVIKLRIVFFLDIMKRNYDFKRGNQLSKSEKFKNLKK